MQTTWSNPRIMDHGARAAAGQSQIFRSQEAEKDVRSVALVTLVTSWPHQK